MNRNDQKTKTRSNGSFSKKDDQTFIVNKETTLLDYVSLKIPSQSRHNVQRIIANHQVLVNGSPVSLFSQKLYPEDEVTISWVSHRRQNVVKLPIIFEDEYIIAINKDTRLLSVGSDNEKQRTAIRLVNDYLKSKNRASRAFVVHRLDEDTSGVLIFAKDYKTKESLQDNWSDIVTKRGYYAVVEGEDIEEGTLKDYLWIDPNTFTVYVTKNKKDGRLAITHYKKIKSGNGYSLLDVNIDTGRKNQIRCQLGNIGHNVVGDDRYGEPSNPLGRLGLHAYVLELTNPLNGKSYKLYAPMPSSFNDLIDKGIKKKVERKKPQRVNKRRRH